MNWLSFTTQVLAFVILVCAAMLASFFSRGRADPVMNALFLFFATFTALYAGINIAEVLVNVSMVDPEYAMFRGLVFRSGVAAAFVWLTYALHSNGGGHG